MTTIVMKLEQGNWVANETQVETLAHERYSGARTVTAIDGTYLRVLLVAIQARLGRKTRGRVALDTQAQVLEETHVKFYDAVLRGVTTDEIAIDETLPQAERSARALERNRRSAFARSAKSTLALAAATGIDLRGLDPATTSKASLRAATAPPEASDKTVRQINRSRGALLRAIGRRAKIEPDEARREIEATIEALEQVASSLDAGPSPATARVERRAPPDRGPARTRVGVPVIMNRSASSGATRSNDHARQ
jgi:hypothetical protein